MKNDLRGEILQGSCFNRIDSQLVVGVDGCKSSTDCEEVSMLKSSNQVIHTEPFFRTAARFHNFNYPRSKGFNGGYMVG